MSKRQFQIDAPLPDPRLSAALYSWLQTKCSTEDGRALFARCVQTCVAPETLEWLATLAEGYGFKRPKGKKK